MSDNATLESAQQVVNVVLVLMDAIVYLFAKWIASRMTGTNQKFSLGPRAIGCIAVIVFSSVVAWSLLHFYLDTKLLASLPPQSQGGYVGSLLGIAIFPALVVLAVVIVRGWLEKRRQPLKAFWEQS